MKTVLSASRRTDIPAFYSDWFLDCLDQGQFELTNPYNGRSRTVEVSRESVAAIVFWSKNYGPLLRRFERLSGWSCVFNFTLNSHDPLLEPGVLSLDERMGQLSSLVELFGPEAVRWRFDPVVFYYRDGRLHDNLHAFGPLLDFAAGLGILACTISFMDPYRKIDRRQRGVPDFAFEYPDSGKMIEVASRMAAMAADRGVKLLTCCEPEIAGAGVANVEAAGCIDHKLIERLYGEILSGRRDRGQRSASGCLCHESIDVGSYDSQPCRCDCLYCYANPVTDRNGDLS
jgi:hypothetical protein